jgi:hypothetical protein
MMAELFQTSKQNISHHVKSIYEEGELNPESTVKKYLTVRQEGQRQAKRNLEYYNLDMIISVGYCVNSVRTTQYSIVQDHLFESDFDRVIQQLEQKDNDAE